MIEEIRKATKQAADKLANSKLKLRQKDLLSQITAEIERMMRQGEWDFAVRLSFYRHEFAKTFKNLDWYPPFLEIRKVRDKIKILSDAD
jgi:hypothetical protein